MKKLLKKITFEAIKRSAVGRAIANACKILKRRFIDKSLELIYNKLNELIIRVGIEYSMVKIIEICNELGIDYRPEIIDCFEGYEFKLKAAKLFNYVEEFEMQHFMHRDPIDFYDRRDAALAGA